MSIGETFHNTDDVKRDYGFMVFYMSGIMIVAILIFKLYLDIFEWMNCLFQFSLFIQGGSCFMLFTFRVTGHQDNLRKGVSLDRYGHLICRDLGLFFGRYWDVA